MAKQERLWAPIIRMLAGLGKLPGSKAMRITRVRGKSPGIFIDFKRRTFFVGVGFDRTRRWRLHAMRYQLQLSRGVTGSFGIGKLWVWFGTWEETA